MKKSFFGKKISCFHISMGKDDIICAHVKDHAEIDFKQAKEMTDTLLKITPDGSRPLMVYLGKIKYITKKARNHFSDSNRKASACAVALIADNPLSIMIAKFFLGLNKPVIPTKLFKRNKEAEKWLKKFL